jgi:UDP-N-acetyl-D-glucosamine dehydrogenase
VRFYDPWIKKYTLRGKTCFTVSDLTEEALEEADLVVVTAAHSNVDYAFVQRHSRFIFDTKNAMREITDRYNIELL